MISLLCPTRERPEWMKRLCNSAFDTAYDKDNIEVVFCIDEDDRDSIEMYEKLKSSNIRARIDSKATLTNYYNMCWEYALGDIFAPINDDFVFESQDWDKYIKQVFDNSFDKILLVYGNAFANKKSDKVNPVWNQEGKAVLGFIHRNWTNVVGRMAPPYFEYHYADVWVRMVAEELGRKVFLPNVDIIHYHAPQYGKISAEQRSSISRVENRKIWKDHKHEIYQEADKLRRFIESYGAKRDN